MTVTKIEGCVIPTTSHKSSFKVTVLFCSLDHKYNLARDPLLFLS